MKQRAGADRRRHRPAGERRRDLRRGRPRQRRAARPHARATIDNALYNAFGQRQVATIYDELNQYRVIMEVAPRYAQGPNALTDVYVPARGDAGTGSARRDVGRRGAAASGDARPSTSAPTRARATRRPATRSATPSTPHGAAVAPSRSFAERATPTSISHQDGELATTISFNLAEGATLAEAQRGDRAGRGRHRHADQRARQLPGHGAGGAAVAGAAAAADRRRASS